MRVKKKIFGIELFVFIKSNKNAISKVEYFGSEIANHLSLAAMQLIQVVTKLFISQKGDLIQNTRVTDYNHRKKLQLILFSEVHF